MHKGGREPQAIFSGSRSCGVIARKPPGQPHCCAIPQQAVEDSPIPLYDRNQNKSEGETSPEHLWPELWHCFWRRKDFSCTPQQNSSNRLRIRESSRFGQGETAEVIWFLHPAMSRDTSHRSGSSKHGHTLISFPLILSLIPWKTWAVSWDKESSLLRCFQFDKKKKKKSVEEGLLWEANALHLCDEGVEQIHICLGQQK